MKTYLNIAFACVAAVSLSACVTTKGSASGPAPTPAPATEQTSGPKPGMDAKGNVIDSKLIESGSGRTVMGINDHEGEITGNPAPKSKFGQLQIGMSMKQVTDIVGQPSDQGGYVTGKAWIPFFFGSDRYRHELVYEKQGRLIFAGSGGFDSNSHLIWIINSANEGRYR
jgi:outer membrane protein assembly factor BamE (lipoprotein component of BamABCDE complex)